MKTTNIPSPPRRSPVAVRADEMAEIAAYLDRFADPQGHKAEDYHAIRRVAELIRQSRAEMVREVHAAS